MILTRNARWGRHITADVPVVAAHVYLLFMTKDTPVVCTNENKPTVIALRAKPRATLARY